MALGLPFMLAAQAMAGFTSLLVPATFAIWLPAARGETVIPVVLTRFTSFAVPETCWIWLPAARGESSVSLAVALMVIAANAAAPRVMRRLRVFIFILLSVLAALHCSTRLLYLSYPDKLETPQKNAAPAG